MPPVRLPPAEVLRAAPPPDDQLLVVRGGRNSLSDANLERATGDCWAEYDFFGVSVFAAPGDDLAALSERVNQIRRRPEVRVARCGELRAAGFEVAATFSNPLHFSVILPDATAVTFAALRSCFSEPVPNPGYEADR
jgi:hypothetical protein